MTSSAYLAFLLYVIICTFVSETALLFWISLSYVHCEYLCARQVLGGILRQTVSHHLGRWWARGWVGWWWLTVVIITTAYTSNLVAFLTVPVFPHRIETVNQLASSSLRWFMQCTLITHILCYYLHCSGIFCSLKRHQFGYQENKNGRNTGSAVALQIISLFVRHLVVRFYLIFPFFVS